MSLACTGPAAHTLSLVDELPTGHPVYECTTCGDHFAQVDGVLHLIEPTGQVGAVLPPSPPDTPVSAIQRSDDYWHGRRDEARELAWWLHGVQVVGEAGHTTLAARLEHLNEQHARALINVDPAEGDPPAWVPFQVTAPAGPDGQAAA